MMQPNPATHQTGDRASAAMAEHRILVVDVIVGKLEHRRSRRFLDTPGTMPGSVGNDHEVAGADLQLLTFDLECAAPLDHRVDPDAIVHRRQLDTPRFRELRGTVEDPGDLNTAQGLAKRSNRGIKDDHV